MRRRGDSDLSETYVGLPRFASSIVTATVPGSPAWGCDCSSDIRFLPSEDDARDHADDLIGDESDAADDDQAWERSRRLLVRARQLDHVSESVFGVHGFCEDHVRSRDCVHHAERVEDLRQRRGDEHRSAHLPLRRAERHRRLHQLFGYESHGAYDDGKQIDEYAEKERSEEYTSELQSHSF